MSFDTKNLPDDVKEMFRRSGSKGGRTTFERYGSEHYAKIASNGGKLAKANRLAKQAAQDAEDAAALSKKEEPPQ